MTYEIPRVIAVVGCQRSGTTLTAQMIGAAPNAFLIDEADGVYRWFHAHAADDEQAPRLFAEAVAKAASKYVEPSKRVRVNADGVLALAPGIQFLVLKAPNLTFEFSAIARLEPRPAVVYPVRDPRAVVASMLELKSIDFTGNQKALLSDSPAVQRLFPEYADALGDPFASKTRQLAIIWAIKSSLRGAFRDSGITTADLRYEDLVADPPKVCRGICDDVGIPFHPDMLRHESVLRGRGPGRTNRRRATDQESLGKWQGALSPEQEHEIMSAVGDAASGFGYA